MNDKVSIAVKNGVSIKILKNLLSELNENSEIELNLCVKEKNHKFNDKEQRLMSICNSLFVLLSEAKRCVEICAENEKIENEHCIYYDKLNGKNGGAIDLLKHIDITLNNYFENLVKVDLI